MLMREWGSRSALRQWGRGRAGRAVLLATALVCVMYALLILAALMDDSDGPPGAPWLRPGADVFQIVRNWLTLVLLVAEFGFTVFMIRCIIRRRRGKPTPEWTRRFVYTPRPPHEVPAYLLGFKWMFSGWRRWTSGLALILSMLAVSAAMLTTQTRRAVLEGFGQAWFMAVGMAACFLWALVLKGREVRRGKEQMKVADEYLAIREARLHQELDAMCEKFLEQQQAWKAQKTAELYEQILDQQARGLLPCPNCAEHRKSA